MFLHHSRTDRVPHGGVRRALWEGHTPWAEYDVLLIAEAAVARDCDEHVRVHAVDPSDLDAFVEQ